MDPSTIPTLAAIVSAIVGGAAGEAGKHAWTSLTALVRRRFGDGDAAVAALEQIDAQSPEEVTKVLVDHAKADAEFEQALIAWTTNTMHFIQYEHDVHNTIAGHAHISGPVIQAGDVLGSINFGKS
ncbi:hypothetical protein E1295_32550 [Nonomuraea mesophila]|uniref:Uncharacterized protein n=1 Tax=Nonomuraea mesophila TaxID=2530382 RepID=A0A4R5EYT0_9ACTN|nr:hypothetical protein [Nonomuraea mesophila]TDE39937.1 hypothetical protein E1295_32550 [Nonomuraea mesophila]